MIAGARPDGFFAEPSVFTARGMLREARRQKRLRDVPVPRVCLLDPDGDIARSLRTSGRGRPHADWPCYHTEMMCFDLDGVQLGVVPCAVGASYAVLVAEELFAAGCELLISVTSAGLLSDEFGRPPYFILIESAWRDEGTSGHYLPPADTVALAPHLRDMLREEFARTGSRVFSGAAWTTDAPFRETESAIAFFKSRGAVAVEMEAAALYAFASACRRDVACFAHVTNEMAMREGDFEKGRDNGASDALEVVGIAVQAWLSRKNSPSTTSAITPPNPI